MPASAYGTWESPITPESIVSENISFGDLRSDAKNLYWLESRPQEGGRCVVVHRDPQGKMRDITPPPYNVRTRTHEYGGSAFCVDEEIVYFSHYADQRLYIADGPTKISPLTPEGPYRYADSFIDRARKRLICVREDHTKSDQNAELSIVAIPLAGNSHGEVLVKGNDFYTAPRLSPDGKQMVWLTWNHPYMPWDGCELWLAELDASGRITTQKCIAGGVNEAIFQPEFSAGGMLYFISDRTGFSNLYRWEGNEAEAIYPLDKDFSLPYWQFGMRTYCLCSEDEIFCSYSDKGTWRLASVDLKAKKATQIACPYTEIGHPLCTDLGVFFEGASPTRPFELTLFHNKTGFFEVFKSSTKKEIAREYISVPQTIEFPTEEGRTAFGFFYPPQNLEYTGKQGELPPLLVKSHGGPTSAASSSLQLKTQFWTSRGFAVLDVNYGGSSGFGREYMKRLEQNWGVVDVADCVNGALYLVKKGLVDKERLAIFGGSAGGYTTLSALTFSDTFRAGASYYGVGDLEALVRDTHKFESRYLDRLIGPYPEKKSLYQDRSPINHVDKLSCPIIFFQGLEDKVVPPNQAETMVDALKKKNIPVEYVPFEGEQHGFRKAENIKTALEREYAFYKRVFGLEF